MGKRRSQNSSQSSRANYSKESSELLEDEDSVQEETKDTTSSCTMNFKWKNRKKIKESKKIKGKPTKANIESKIKKEIEHNLKTIMKEEKKMKVEDSHDNLLPQMKESSLRKLEELLEFKEFDESKLSLNKCTLLMRSNSEPHILFLSVLRKAIVNSLLERRWDNLVELLMMLVDNFYSVIFTNFLRQVCELLYHLDPRIDEELGAQLDLIRKVYKSKRETTNIV